ncbi:unnamed protein product [Arctogadus glacialis]
MQQKPSFSNLIPSADAKDGRYWFKTPLRSCYRLDWTRLAAQCIFKSHMYFYNIVSSINGLKHASCDRLEVNIWIILMEQTSLPSVEDGLRPIIEDGLKHTSCDRLEVNIWIIPMEQTSLPSAHDCHVTDITRTLGSSNGTDLLPSMYKPWQSRSHLRDDIQQVTDRLQTGNDKPVLTCAVFGRLEIHQTQLRGVVLMCCPTPL